jgi:hypothetical protein
LKTRPFQIFEEKEQYNHLKEKEQDDYLKEKEQYK